MEKVTYLRYIYTVLYIIIQKLSLLLAKNDAEVVLDAPWCDMV